MGLPFFASRSLILRLPPTLRLFFLLFSLFLPVFAFSSSYPSSSSHSSPFLPLILRLLCILLFLSVFLPFSLILHHYLFHHVSLLFHLFRRLLSLSSSLSPFILRLHHLPLPIIRFLNLHLLSPTFCFIPLFLLPILRLHPLTLSILLFLFFIFVLPSSFAYFCFSVILSLPLQILSFEERQCICYQIIQ